MRVHLINKHLILDYLQRNKEAKKGVSTWLTIMANADWNTLSDMNETFGFTLRQVREVTFYIAAASVRISCRCHFLANRVHLIIRKIEIHEVQGNQVERAIR